MQRLSLNHASILILAALPQIARASGNPTAAPASPAAPAAAVTVEAAMQTYGELLGRYVTPGGVRYAAWRAKPDDVAALSGVVTTLSAADMKKLAPKDLTATYINLYNSKVLEIVLKENPKTSIKEVSPGITGFGVFLKSVLNVGGEKLSLRQLEDRLREQSKDPRIHFAINCASRSCPPIASEPYRGTALDEQLDRSVKAFLASPGAVVLEPGKTLTVQASKIFDWYEKDFKPMGGPLAFIAKYGPPEAADALKKAGTNAKIEHQDYNWSLNSAPEGA